MYNLFIIGLIFLVLSAKSFTQIYYPMSVGNKYQIEEYMDASNGESWNWFTAEITKDSTYNDTTFYNFSHKESAGNFIKGLFHFDKEAQKLYRLTDIGKKLAVDFNLASGIQYGSVIESGYAVYTSDGQSTDLILGEIRNRYRMGRSWSVPYNNFSNVWIFADSIGCYHVENNHQIVVPAEHQHWHYTVISAIIDSQSIRPIPLNVQVFTQLDDRFLNEFPFNVAVDVNVPILPLLDSLYLTYEVERDSIVILQERVDFNRILFRAPVDLDSTVLKVGDVVKLKVVVTDKTIFNNYVVKPDTGYFRINVLPNPTGIDSERFYLSSFTLHQNFPNPFNPMTNIIYEIPEESFVSLKVFDLLGNEIATIVNENVSAGIYEVDFDGSELTSGVYFYQLTGRTSTGSARQIVKSKKMVLMK